MASTKKREDGFLYQVARVIRFFTVPPLVVAATLVLLLWFDDVFLNLTDFYLSLVFLAVLPALAYPVQLLVPAFRPGGRRMQRKLAFVFSTVGYIGAVIASAWRGAVPNLLYIAVVYLLSVVLLTLINTLSPFHASGHGCGIAGPVILLCCFLSEHWYFVIGALALFALCFWASVYMKRHTVREFLLGALTSVLSAFLCYCIIYPNF